MKTIRLDSIKSNERNPRQITPEQFQKLMQSIADLPAMMELRPIIVDSDGVILGGNMRHKALLQMGMVEVPETWVRKADSLTKEDTRRFIIADNIGFGEWDMDILSADYDLPVLEAWGLSLKSESPGEDLEQKEAKMEANALLDQSIQLEPDQEYVLIRAKDQAEWDEMIQYFRLKKVRRGGYKKGSAFDAVGTERVLTFDRVKSCK
jgi:hypothetical protein